VRELNHGYRSCKVDSGLTTTFPKKKKSDVFCQGNSPPQARVLLNTIQADLISLFISRQAYGEKKISFFMSTISI
jgi:hypothetical protein